MHEFILIYSTSEKKAFDDYDLSTERKPVRFSLGRASAALDPTIQVIYPPQSGSWIPDVHRLKQTQNDTQIQHGSGGAVHIWV